MGEVSKYQSYVERSVYKKIDGISEKIDGKLETISWAWERSNGGRSLGFSGLHFHKNWNLTAYRRLMIQAILWTLKLSIPVNGVNVDIS